MAQHGDRLKQVQSDLHALSQHKKDTSEKLKALHGTLHDSIDKEQRTQQIVEKQQCLVNYHRQRADTVTKQISQLNRELKEQERTGWNNLQKRDARMIQNRRANHAQSHRAAEESMSKTLTRSVARSSSEPRLRRTERVRVAGGRGGAAMAAGKLAVPGAAPDFGDAVMGLVGSRSDGMFRGDDHSASSSSRAPKEYRSQEAMIASQDVRRGSGNRSGVASRGTDRSIVTPGSEHSSSPLLDWFDGKDEVESKKPLDLTASWGNDDDLYLEVENKDKDPTAELKKKEEARLNAQLEQERRLAITAAREKEMDYQAELRRAAEQRRKVNQCREEIRNALVESAGSAKEAYKVLDCTGSGRVSLNELDGGMRSLGVNYEELTGMTKLLQLFLLFDHDKKGYVTFANLFPLDARNPEPESMSTPRFWQHWCNQNEDVTEASSSSNARIPTWEPSGPEEKLALISNNRDQKAEVERKKKWMRGMIQRLKTKGKSDARCREITALHLPRGTGPRDMQDVNTFTHVDVAACRKKYQDKVQESVRKIEKTVFDLHDHRKKLHTTKQQLWALTEEPLLRAKAVEDAKVSLCALSGGGGLQFNKYQEDAEH